MCMPRCFYCAPRKSAQVQRVLAQMVCDRHAEEALRQLTVRLRAVADARQAA